MSMESARKAARQERLAKRLAARRAALDTAAKRPDYAVVVPFRAPKRGNDRPHKNVRRGG